MITNICACLCGLDLTKALVLEGIDSLWTLAFAVRENREDDLLIRRHIQICRSADVKSHVGKKFGGTLLTTW